MFANIPSSSDRHTTCCTCMAEVAAHAADQAAAEAQRKKDQITAHFEKILFTWATSSDPTNKFSSMNSVSIPIVPDIPSDTYTAWKTDFEAKGYTVVNDTKRFTVSHA